MRTHIPADVRDAMVDRFSEACDYHERVACAMLGVQTLTGTELKACVEAADNEVFEEFGFRIREIFTK